MPKIIPETEARQGNKGKQTLIVLIAALILAAIVWGGVEFYGETIDNHASQSVPNG